MPIEIKITGQNVTEIAACLSSMATAMLHLYQQLTTVNNGHAQTKTVDSPINDVQDEPAVELVASPAPRKRGRPQKTEVEATPEPAPESVANGIDHAPEEASASPNKEDLVNRITSHFLTNEAKKRTAITSFKRSIGVGLLKEMGDEHLLMAAELVASLDAMGAS
jgi:hypothetical protein